MRSDSIVTMDFGTDQTRYVLTLTKYNTYISETYYVLNRASRKEFETTFHRDNEIAAARNVESSISSACGLYLEDKAESDACLQLLISK